MNDIIAMHYCFGVNPYTNKVHNKFLSWVQQSGISEILIANHVIMLLIVLPKNFVSGQIQFDSQVALAACLLQWDQPFPLGGPLVVVLPAGVFSCALVHTLLPPNW
jgi:hypothetical protein